MKISIITVTLNNQETILDTLNSVKSQTYPNIEHILVDGGSTDKTWKFIKEYKFKKKKCFKKKNFGIYKSINYAIKNSSGEYILILNSDDIFHSNETVEKYAKFVLKNRKVKIFFGDVIYFKNNNYNRIVRHYSGANFNINQMKFGLMPPHPSSLISIEIYKNFGLYDENYKIASDFEIFLKFLFKNKIKFKYYDAIITRMRLGGISSKNLFSRFISTIEILKAFRKNNIEVNIFFIIFRFLYKLPQLYFFNEKKLNKFFKIFKIINKKEYYQSNTIKISNNFEKILLKNNFIYAALNLACFGYIVKKKIFINEHFFTWCDGVWASKMTGIDKMPGRELVKNIPLLKKIKKIHVIGDLSDNSKSYLMRYKLKIINTKIEYGNFEKIKKKIKLSKSTLVFITLPTPKQEQFANYLKSINKYYKIICIGASIRIASGDEKPVPNFMKKFEFLWRLKHDPIRRIIRITESLIFFIKGKYLSKTLDKIRYYKID